MISHLALLLACSLLAEYPWPGQVTQQDGEVSRLIEDLRTLSPDASAADFRNRPAVLELIALGPLAIPSLTQACRSSDHWAVKTSAAFVLAVISRPPLDVMSSWMQDESAHVRAFAASYLGIHGGDVAENLRNRPEEKAILQRLQPHDLETTWIREPYFSKWMAANLDVLGRGNPLTTPTEGGIRGAFLPSVKREYEDAAGALAGALGSGDRGHLVLEQLLRNVETAAPDNPELVAYKLGLLAYAPMHKDAACLGNPCQEWKAFAERIVSLCERSLAGSSNPSILAKSILVLSTLLQVSGDAAAGQLLKRLNSDHPNVEVRTLAGEHLAAHARRTDENAGAKLRREENQKRLAQDRASTQLKEPPASPPPGSPHRAPRSKTTPTSSSWIWMAVALVGSGLLVGTYWKLQKR